VASKIGCAAQTLWQLGAASETPISASATAMNTTIDSGSRNWSEENRELPTGQRDPGKASAFFRQAELDRRPK